MTPPDRIINKSLERRERSSSDSSSQSSGQSSSSSSSSKPSKEQLQQVQQVQQAAQTEAYLKANYQEARTPETFNAWHNQSVKVEQMKKDLRS